MLKESKFWLSLNYYFIAYNSSKLEEMFPVRDSIDFSDLWIKINNNNLIKSNEYSNNNYRLHTLALVLKLTHFAS